MNSMTGFGLARLGSPEVSVEVSLRSVNSRFLELRFQLPRELAHLESRLRQQAAKKLRRGTVDIYIQRRIANLNQRVKVEVQLAAAQKWLKAYQTLAQELKIPASFDVSQIGSQPQVMSLKEDLSPSLQEEKLIFEAFDRALVNLVKERQREGLALKKEVLSLLKQLQKNLKGVQKLSKAAALLHREKLEGRLSKLNSEAVDPQRLAQEVVLLVDRADVQEEVVRLREHLGQCLALTKAKRVEGKKIEFYAQELLRELNTIGSKSSQAELTGLVVDGKSLIEKLKEQAANIE